MANELIDLRGAFWKEMARDFNEALAPAIADCKSRGMTDEEINLELNRAFFDAFKGMHRFPDSHRP